MRGELSGLAPDKVAIPEAIRSAFATFTSPATAALSGAEILPYLNQVVETLGQIPLLIEEVSLRRVLQDTYV